jgi:hypothetical protein
MTAQPQRRLRAAVVLASAENECTVFADDRSTAIEFADFFPRPRGERVLPGHLVAIEAAHVCWRWFDAVVVDEDGGSVRLWEPAHGVVIAARRDPGRTYRPGTRAYLSAGLPGADWWVAGPVVDRAEDADVELDEVEGFLVDHGLRGS